MANKKTYGVGIGTGLAIGVAFALLTNNWMMGLCIGVAIGYGGSTIAATRDKLDKKE